MEDFMNHRNKFALLFYIREDRAKEGKAPIYLRITVQNSKVAFPINTFVNTDNWDSAKGLAKPRTFDADDINSSINLWRNRIYEAQMSYILADQASTAEMIKKQGPGH